MSLATFVKFTLTLLVGISQFLKKKKGSAKMASSNILVLLVLVHVIVFPNIANAQTNSNLTLGSAITAGDASTHLLLPSGEFTSR